MAAPPDDADYGLLTLLVQLNYEPKQFFKIPATCFYPEPDVDSAWRLPGSARATGLSAAQSVGASERQSVRASELRTTFVKVVKRSFRNGGNDAKVAQEDWPAEKLAQIFAD